MRRKLSLVVCTSAFLTILVLTGCGSNGMNPMQSGTAAQGPPPTVWAVATQVNGVAPNRRQEVQFSEAMDASTINAQSFKVTDGSGNAVAGAVSYDANFDTASFQPNPALASNTSYTATITTAASSSGGARLAKPYSYTFTTRASTDTSPLSVNSVSPAANATCVSATSLITITFNEVPDAATVTAANFALTGPGGAISVKLSTDVTTTQVVLTPSAALPSGTISVTVNNVADLAGVKMTAPYSWNFSTACGGGGGTGGGGIGGGGGATTQYMAPLFSDGPGGLAGPTHGQVTVDTSGNTTAKLSGAPASTTYTVQFCPSFNAGATTIPAPNCFDVTTISTDASGNGTATAKFPRAGDWAGDFGLNDSTGKAAYQTFATPLVSNETFMATLVPDDKTNGGAVAQPGTTQLPLSSGTVTLSDGAFQFTLKGAMPNATYRANDSETTYMDSSGTYWFDNSFATDASGNGSFSTGWETLTGGDLFQVEYKVPDNITGDYTPAYIGGFSVPQ